MNNDNLINKNLYKLFLQIVKFIPISLSIMAFVSLLLNFIGVSSILLSYIGGTSLIFIVLLYLIAIIFRFCWMYKIPLGYLTIIIIMNMLRTFGFLPIDLMDLYRIYAAISGIFVSLFIGYVYKNRNNQKIDYIKNLCERYNYCN